MFKNGLMALTYVFALISIILAYVNLISFPMILGMTYLCNDINTRLNVEQTDFQITGNMTTSKFLLEHFMYTVSCQATTRDNQTCLFTACVDEDNYDVCKALCTISDYNYDGYINKKLHTCYTEYEMTSDKLFLDILFFILSLIIFFIMSVAVFGIIWYLFFIIYQELLFLIKGIHKLLYFLRYSIELDALPISSFVTVQNKETCNMCKSRKCNIITKCKHQFCYICLNDAFKENTTCPTCKHEIVDTDLLIQNSRTHEYQLVATHSEL
jgi:hypothetical protein